MFKNVEKKKKGNKFKQLPVEMKPETMVLLRLTGSLRVPAVSSVACWCRGASACVEPRGRSTPSNGPARRRSPSSVRPHPTHSPPLTPPPTPPTSRFFLALKYNVKRARAHMHTSTHTHTHWLHLVD